MAAISRIKRFTRSEIEQLSRQGLKTVDDLWNRIGEDFDQGIHDLSSKTGVGRNPFLQILIDEAVDEPRREGWRPVSLLRRHWPDATVLFLAVLTLLAVLQVAGSGTAVAPERASVVKTTVALPAFHIIGQDDLKLVEEEATEDSEGFSSWKEVLGRFPLKPIGEDTVLKADDLSEIQLSPSDAADRYVVSLPARAGSLIPEAKQGWRGSLLVVSRRSDEAAPLPVMVDDAIALSIERKDDAAVIVVAIPEAGLEEIKPLLGAFEVFLASPIEMSPRRE